VIDCGSLDYAQARLQARHGQRATEAIWQRIETAREFTALVEVARASSLRPWLVGITAPADVQQIEAVLRGHWRAAVAEAVGWTAPDWQAALAWCAVLPDLPLLQHLARGGQARDWMGDDPVLRRLCAAPAAERQAALAATGLGDLGTAWAAAHSPGAAWQQAWQAGWWRRVPQAQEDIDDSLRQVVAAVQAHAAAFAAAPPGPGGLLRRALRARLSLLLRRATLQPAALVIHLVLSALDLEHLRGELLRRALFTPAQGQARRQTLATSVQAA
jgi:hypothetical protein